MAHENNLYALRFSKHLTQKQFAEEAGIHPGVYSRYERGETDIPLSVAKRIAETFNASIDYIACLSSEIDYETIAENSDMVKRAEIEELKRRIEQLEESIS
ncbi:MAG: helix-turn-helix domain-containing protein [Oscillospiraceae bacterium]|nr:helix-turn-helix domain-containing protein [Oscillospiraceae bacterium]